MKANAKNNGRARRPLNEYPRGWGRKKVRRLIDHYENQTEEEAVAEDEAAFNDPAQAAVLVPQALVPAVHRQIARHRAKKPTHSAGTSKHCR